MKGFITLVIVLLAAEQISARDKRLSDDCLTGVADRFQCCVGVPDAWYAHLRNPYNCSQFFQCTHEYPVLKNCPDNLEWSVDTDRCEWPFSAQCKAEPLPTTQDPTTRDPTTQDPTTKNPTTLDPTTKNPTTQDPTTKDSTTQNPTTQDPTTQDPTTQDSTTQDPTTQEPTTQKPTTHNPTTQDPTTQDPTTQRPTTQRPTTQAPTTRAPTTKVPSTHAPTTEAPTTEAPTTQAPTTEAHTTQDPTTKDPTTQDPTTQDPTTQDPTTETPTQDPHPHSHPTIAPTPVPPKPDNCTPAPICSQCLTGVFPAKMCCKGVKTWQKIHLENTHNCKSYYECVNEFPVLRWCPKGLHWSVKSDRCEWPHNSECRRRPSIKV